MRYTAVVVMVLLCYSNGVAQSNRDSATMLLPVTITQSQLNTYVIEPNYLALDSLTLALSRSGSLADLFRKQGYGHIRSYGPGGLTTASFRGSGSSHTAILWNGINVGSPLNGQTDMSLIPMSIFQSATLQTGGNSGVSGSGAIGGTINLSNDLSFRHGISATASGALGSFGTRYADASVSGGTDRIAGSLQINTNTIDNDYRYLNTDRFPAVRQRRQNAKFTTQGLLAQVGAKVTRQDIISLRSWLQTSTYQIPNPVSFTYPGQSDERNEVDRYMLDWTHQSTRFRINTQSALLRQRLRYRDLSKSDESNSDFTSFVQNVEVNGQLTPSLQMIGGINYTLETSDVEQYGIADPRRNRTALFYGVRFDQFWRYNLALAIREELINGNTTPLAPSFSGSFRIDSAFTISAKVTRNYRIPTMNDLYWFGVGAQGNPNLKAEVGWSEEISLVYDQHGLNTKLTIFNSFIDNWIIWNPTPGYGWSPQNIKNVWSRGLEFQSVYNRSFGELSVQTIGRYTLAISTNEAIYENGNPNEIDKQLILTPRHEFSLLGEGTYKGCTLRVEGSFTGKQFNDTDNSRYNIVKPYFITNIWATRGVRAGQLTGNLTAEVANIFNVDYLARPGYPNPGTNFRIGLTINFNNYKHG